MDTLCKTCFKCGGEKPLSEFYRHKMMADGHLNKCKVCAKADAMLRYLDPDARLRIKDYDKRRFRTASRKEKLKVYQRKRRANDPQRYRANYTLTNAVRDKRIVKKPCEVCGDRKSEGHHLDYAHPLAVRWLCFKHHRQLHGQRVMEEAQYAA